LERLILVLRRIARPAGVAWPGPASRAHTAARAVAVTPAAEPGAAPAAATLSAMTSEVQDLSGRDQAAGTGAGPAGQDAAPHTTAGKIADLQRRRDEAVHAGSARAVEQQHAKGKMTARERLERLLDPGSFTEFDELARHRATDFGVAANRPYGDGVVTGYGTIDGRPVCVFSQDFTVFGGSLGEVYGEKIVKLMDHALKTGCPLIGINDGGGARIQEGVVALGLFAEIFFRNVTASGVIPQISLIMGPCAGGAVYSPAITDFTLMVEGTSHMFITGPDVIKTVTGEEVSFEELGGAHAHNTKSGVAHYQARDEADCLEFARDLLSYLPSNNLDDAPVLGPPGDPDAGLEITGTDRELDTVIPDSPNQPYDMHDVITRILDDGEFLEIHAGFAQNIVVGFGRVEGASVGVVANQPMHFAGTLDIDAAEKAARFVRTCDCFNIPVLTFVDVPGFLPGTGQEWGGIIRRGAKLIYAYAEATVPKITVITRKAYGGAYDVMGSKHLGGDINLAWPTAQIAVMGAQGAVNILYRRELASAGDPDTLRARRVAEYEDTLANPYIAAERGYVDAVIRPAETRAQVTRALRTLRTKRQTLPPKKHGNIPL
jgi:propionyl-CoA carboxylase beta chain